MKERPQRIGVIGAPGAFFGDDTIDDSSFKEEEPR